MDSKDKELASLANLRTASKTRLAKKALTIDEFQGVLQRSLAGDNAAIIAKAKEQALNGDKFAREWLYERAYGKAPLQMQINSTIEHKYSGQVNVAVLAAKAALELKDGKI